MAKGVTTLIRISELTVDESRRELGKRLKELDDLEAATDRLEKEVINEQRTAAAQPETVGFLYGVYADTVIHRREQFQLAIESKEQEVSVAREALSDAYYELKKYEVFYENQQRAEAEEKARKDQIELDELGLFVHSKFRNSSIPKL